MQSRDPWIWDLVELAAALAAGDLAAEDAVCRRLLDAGREAEVEEVLLQSYLFLGFPVAIEAFRRWRTLGTSPRITEPDGRDAWSERGERVCRAIYGGVYERLREKVSNFHPDLDRWMLEEGYGKVLGRPGLPLDVRELCAVAMLAVLGARRQLRSHLMGALNAGARADEVDEAVRRAARLAPRENRALAEKVWSGVRDRR